MLSIIAAVQEKNRGIGYKGKDLYRLPPDRKHFQELTMRHAVLMGSNTWEAIPEKFRPLPDRVNVIITRNENFKAPKGVHVAHSIEEAIEKAEHSQREIFIIGGGEIYTQSLAYANRLYLTIIRGEKKGNGFITREADTFFPEYAGFKELSRESHTYESDKTEKVFEFDFVVYAK